MNKILLIVALFVIATLPFDTFLSTVYIVKSIFSMLLLIVSLFLSVRGKNADRTEHEE